MQFDEYYWVHELERLREEQSPGHSMPQLQLPLPVPYSYHYEQEVADDTAEDPTRGVVIIDMFNTEES
jgi:hypothetical protein